MQPVQHPDAHAEQEMPEVFFGSASRLATGPRSSDQRVGLTRRPADQDRVVEGPSESGDGLVDGRGGRIGTLLEAACFLCGLNPRGGVDLRPVRFVCQTGMKIHEGFRQSPAQRAIGAKECV